ncbi:MAG TPA: valine--tRNA ligase [Candidatus Paceibacterota bacterium]
MEINEKFLKPYSAKDTEDRIYKLWEDSGFFNPDICIEKGATDPNAPIFSLVLPPPNVTGRLHMGHALEHSLQDAVIRFNRMRGKRTLWVPGTDHAAIATQARFEKDLNKETGKSRHDFSREEFFNMVQEFGLKNQKEMQKQMRLLGSSLDWSREAFTLDEKRSLAVRTAFKTMYNEGLIYRGYRVINWDPKGQTTIADDEVVYEERKGKLYTFKYGKDFPIAISTTRPETKVGDVAVAVHPEDDRYREFVGKEYDAVFCGVPIHIKIIADDKVEKDFGTGALGVTPAHSQIDWEMSQQHKLPVLPVINEYAKMTVGDERILGKKTTEAREVIVEWLRNENLLEKEEEINQNISTSERTGAVVEPLPKLQWFIDVNKPIPSKGGKTLKDLMKEPVADGQVKIMPEHFERVYFNWIDNLRDWCISRQILYGHRIPVWYKGEEIYSGTEAPSGEGWQQDADSLDTWFSSGLWTFSTLGWPEKTKDLESYHPTSFMNPGYEILFFWVARMVMLSKYLLDDIPFRTVYIHGMVRDAKGQKFSKSLKNGVEPEEIISQFGTDAIRMSMVVGIGPGNDVNFDTQKVKAYSKFANKIWNATRFVLEQTKDIQVDNLPAFDEEDKKSDSELNDLIKETTKEMEEYKLYLVSEKLYHYFWHTFADVLIERSKKKILENTNSDSAKALLYTQLTTLLKLLHPFMPFITEEIWSLIPKKGSDLLMVERWPLAEARDLQPKA